MRKGEVVVITGASAGLGRAIAREFGKHRARIGLIARDRNRLETAKQEIEEMGGEAMVLPLDVSNEQQVDAAASAVEEAFGPIDIWVNDAMVSVFSPVKEMKPDEYRRVTDVTYLGYVWGTMAALKRMMHRNRGMIVQVGSALSYRSIPLQSAYCAAKHAINGFTDSLRSELIHDKSNVGITTVHMPALNTPQFGWERSRLTRNAQPVPPIFQPEVGARAVYWAAHHRRREVYVGWPTVKAILGNKFFAGYIDRYLGRTGYASQQYDGIHDTTAPDNLFEPVPGNQGAHGDFDDRSKDHSIQQWVDRHRRGLTMLGGTLIGAFVALRAFRRNGGNGFARLTDGAKHERASASQG